MLLPTNRMLSVAYTDGSYEQAGNGESPPSSSARPFLKREVIANPR
jgi:hypothetical protein